LERISLRRIGAGGHNGPMAVTIQTCEAGDAQRLLAADVFDRPAQASFIADFFRREGHHLLGAFDGDAMVGFVSGIEVAHPDKPLEMLLYELGVNETHRRRGIGRDLVLALRSLAVERRCSTMWVPLDGDDVIAQTTYRSAGANTFEDAAVMTWDLQLRG
jgi:ribosomal protein S18 acetylase RimI-like enzyme